MTDIDENNAWISWGRCFFDNSGDEAPSRYIPCGNVNFGHISCCESRDMCLSSGACYNGQFGVTYLAGCTDQAYKHQSCPDKGPYSGDAWLGLAYCNGSSNEWIACDNNRGTKTVTQADACYCPHTTHPVAIHDASHLADIVDLGAATGESVTWQGGFIPNSATITVMSSESPTLSQSLIGDPRASADDAATATSPPSSSAVPAVVEQPDESGLGTGTKAGIGVGVGAACIVLAAIVFGLARLSKRRKNQSLKDDPPTSSAQPVTLYDESHLDDGDLRSPCWSGHKSELDAVGTASPSPRYDDFGSAKSGTEASPTSGPIGGPLVNGGYQSAGQKEPVYEMPA